jgi:hypothetical protein
MLRRRARPLALAALAIAAIGLLAPAAAAHEQRAEGDLEMVVGFGTEPAYAGQPNSVQIVLTHDGQPVTDLGDTLDVEVSFGDETVALELEPVFGEPGEYRAWFIPTRPGQYEFHFSGTIDGEQVDETFASGPGTFSDVENPADIQFPVQDPTNGELAERLDREASRLGEAIERAGGDVAADAGRALEEATRASDDVAGARTFGILGFATGAAGLALAVGALAASRRKAG